MPFIDLFGEIMTFDCTAYCYPTAYLCAEACEAQAEAGGLLLAAVESGLCAVALEEGLAYAAAGDIILAQSPTALYAQQGCRLHGLLLGGLAARAAADSLPQPCLLRAAACPEVATLLQEICDNGPQLAEAELGAQCYALLCRLGAAAGQAGHPPLVDAALGEMHAHYAEVYGVQELADNLGVDKSHLIRRFTSAMGISPGRYLTGVRVAHAKRLLLMREFSLESIANLCGFSGANYMSKVFRRETGEAPSAWLRRAGKAAAPLRTEWEDRAYL